MGEAIANGFVVDSDLHNVVPSVRALFPYLTDHWREYIEQSGFSGATDDAYPPGMPTSARPDAQPPDGGPPGSDLALLRAQALDPWGTTCGILNCAYAVDGIHNPDAAAAIASAVNDWQVAEWLDREPRLRASVVVAAEEGALAAEEIDRRGGDRRFVQVLLTVRTMEPLGRRRYWPIYEAAERHGLPLASTSAATAGTRSPAQDGPPTTWRTTPAWRSPSRRS